MMAEIFIRPLCNALHKGLYQEQPAGRQNDKEMEQWLSEIRLRADLRIGEISLELEKAKLGSEPGRRGGNGLPLGGIPKNEALKAAGLSTQEASRCERLASIPPEKVEALVAEKKAEGKPVTTKEALKLANCCKVDEAKSIRDKALRL